MDLKTTYSLSLVIILIGIEGKGRINGREPNSPQLSIVH